MKFNRDALTKFYVFKKISVCKDYLKDVLLLF